MKIAKKDNAMSDKQRAIRAAIGVVAAGVLVLVVYYAVELCRVWKLEMEQRAVMSWELGAQNHYQVMAVSDDANWFLMPEARVRFPYFVPQQEGHSEYRPLRYSYQVNGAPTGAGFKEDFIITITYGLNALSNAMNEDNPQECVGMYMLVPSSSEWSGGQYEKVKDFSLADGRELSLWRNNDTVCQDLKHEVRMPELLLTRLGGLESY